MGMRDALRAATVGRGTTAKIHEVEIDGNAFGIRTASIADIEAIQNASGSKIGAAGSFTDNINFTIAAIVNQVVDPATGERVFDATDREAFKSQTMDGWFKELMDSVQLAFPKKKDPEEGNDSKQTD